jgi:hypothetical protein
LWDGYLARPCIISGQDCPHHKKFWDIFLVGSL